MPFTAPSHPPRTADSVQRRPWKPSFLSWLIAVIALAGAAGLLYPAAASWISSYNQSQLLLDYDDLLANAKPPVRTQLQQAHAYNEALQAGVDVEAHQNIATGQGVLLDEDLVYEEILSVNESGLMGRVKIPSIAVDLPIYHGTSDQVLGKGAGHLEGSHLPVGGAGTHAVITAHRGLADAEMFTHLDRVKISDRFTVEVFGEVLTYEVKETKVVEPQDTDTLRPQADLDQVTLITCTPLGINSHRILVTGVRVPTQASLPTNPGAEPDIPGFPWWIVWGSLALALASAYLWRAGYADARSAATAGGPEADDDAQDDRTEAS